ncbi:DENN domain-containing protein 3-like [Antennarius striatus]|uniref:DENN domain-containing protein 3-like n=1 Tax=Antennarius striatus TaxID=241820 RepID=UPI0035B3E1B6
MVDYLPPVLLEACVVLGASEEKLSEVFQAAVNNGTPENTVLEPEVLHVLAPPFISGPQAASKRVRSHGKRRRKERPSAATTPTQGGEAEGGSRTENVHFPKVINLMAMPQLCFPGGLHITTERRDEQFHFLVFTDVFGKKTYGVVMQCYRPILDETSLFQNGADFSQLFTAYSFCVISKCPYFTALKDCLSCLLIQLRDCRLSDMKSRVKVFATKLALVPVPPPGQLHLMFTLSPLTIVLPSKEDKDLPTIDLDLHLPFFCFRPLELLQVLSCLLQERRVVLFSDDWARLTLVAESFLLFLQPLSWQQPYVPVLARGMLDFLMVPTAFLMGCHLSHFKEIAAETDDLILVNIDRGSVSTSCCEVFDLPEIPPCAADCFTQRCLSLKTHFDLYQCQRASCTDISEQRLQRRAWQHNLNHEIQRITLELIVNIFRDVGSHLNCEHRVFNSEEFLKTRDSAEQLFYKKVLGTHIFHSFLKDRLNRKLDNFARMELETRFEMNKMRAVLETPSRVTKQEIHARRKSSVTENGVSKRCQMSLPDLEDHQTTSFHRNTLLTGISRMSDTALRIIRKRLTVFKLPDFPASLSVHSVQSFHTELIQLLSKTIFSAQKENPTLLARYYYLRGFINTLRSRHLDALGDFQNLYKTDTALFPTPLVTWLVDSMNQDERRRVEKRPELKRLVFKVMTERKKLVVQSDDHVKKFELPCKHLHQEEFVRCVQECGIVNDVATIHRLFDALTEGQTKQVDPKLFKVFYTVWKEKKSETQDLSLPSEVNYQLDDIECVYKLSQCVKTSRGVGKIAVTQKRLFLLIQGQPGFLEITKFRDIQEVKVIPALLFRFPALHIQTMTSGRPEVFEANLKTETGLWSLLVKEMWAGRKLSDQHKDPQYLMQALTNILLMDAVMGSLQTQRSITAASKLAYFDKIKHEVPMMVPKTTTEMLKHKINPSLDLAEPQTVHVLLYTPGQLSSNDAVDDMNPKLWVALSGGRVVVFDASSWSILQASIQVGQEQLNCMLGLIQEQVWIGSQDSVIYIIDTHSMSCNRQLTEHRHEVTGLTGETIDQCHSQQIYSCSCDGTILQWDSDSLKVTRQLHLSCEHLSSIQIHAGTLWCCCRDSIVVLEKSGTPQKKITLPDDLRSISSSFSSFIVIPERGQLWTGCANTGEVCLWYTNYSLPAKRILLPGSSGVTCMIRVKDQIWVAGHGKGWIGGQCDGNMRSQLLVMNPESLTVTKELQAHADSIQTLCSAEDRYVLSGSAWRDGKIAIWKVE